MWRRFCPCFRTTTPPLRQSVTTQTERILPAIALSDAPAVVEVTIAPIPKRLSVQKLVDLEVVADAEYEHV